MGGDGRVEKFSRSIENQSKLNYKIKSDKLNHYPLVNTRFLCRNSFENAKKIMRR